MFRHASQLTIDSPLQAEELRQRFLRARDTAPTAEERAVGVLRWRVTERAGRLYLGIVCQSLKSGPTEAIVSFVGAVESARSGCRISGSFSVSPLMTLLQFIFIGCTGANGILLLVVLGYRNWRPWPILVMALLSLMTSIGLMFVARVSRRHWRRVLLVKLSSAAAVSKMPRSSAA